MRMVLTQFAPPPCGAQGRIGDNQPRCHVIGHAKARSFKSGMRARTYNAVLHAGPGDDAVADRGMVIAKKAPL
jgi:hypothetical protein